MDKLPQVCVVIDAFSVQTMRRKPIKQVFRRYPYANRDTALKIASKLRKSDGSKPCSVFVPASKESFPP